MDMPKAISRALWLSLIGALCLFTSGCGKIWGGITFFGGSIFPSTGFVYSCPIQVFLLSNANNSNGPATQGSGWTYSISPNLPTGLSLNPMTGIISGTPTVITAMTAYLVTITSAMGVTTATVNIRTANGILVNDLVHDAHNNVPGTCSSLAFGTCNPRAAIEEAISSGPPVILMPAGTNILTLGQLSITAVMDVYGDCAQKTVLDGANASRVLHVTAGPTNLINLTIQNGLDNTSGGAGIYFDGIAGNFSVTLQNSLVQNNSYSSVAWSGGGIRTNGDGHTVTVSISNSIIQNNSATAAGGQGGGLSLDTGSQDTITNSLIQNNSVGGSGAGIFVGGGPNTVSQSLILNNSAPTDIGGGVYGSAGTLTLLNDTIYGNTGTGGGGVGSGNTGTINIINSTIFGNSSNNGGVSGGGIDTVNGGTAVQVSNSIVASNQNTGGLMNCHDPIAILTSGGYNMSDSGECPFASGGDRLTINPKLGPLQNNGGSTNTLALLPGSPAIGAVLNSSCPATDQRGVTRPANACAIGSYE